MLHIFQKFYSFFLSRYFPLIHHGIQQLSKDPSAHIILVLNIWVICYSLLRTMTHCLIYWTITSTLLWLPMCITEIFDLIHATVNSVVLVFAYKICSSCLGVWYVEFTDRHFSHPYNHDYKLLSWSVNSSWCEIFWSQQFYN